MGRYLDAYAIVVLITPPCTSHCHIRIREKDMWVGLEDLSEWIGLFDATVVSQIFVTPRPAKIFFLCCITRLWAQGTSHAT